MSTGAIRTRIAHFRDHDPNLDYGGFQYFPDGVLVYRNGVIEACDSAEALAAQGFDLTQCRRMPEHLLMAGFVDAHVHAPQMKVMASYGEQLLQWLNKYTFPAESEFADASNSAAQTDAFVQALLANGTTSAMVFTTSYKHSTEQLFRSAQARGMAVVGGKVLMDRNAPAVLLDTAESAERDCRALIADWHGRDRLGFAITPRFAGTSTIAQLQAAGRILRDHPDVWVQTHLSENTDEIQWTASLYPEAKDYLDVYECYGLHTARSVFAHCVHLTTSEFERIAATGSAIAFCPSSNLFLGSGLFDYAEAKARQIPVALATDVGAGTSLSQFKTMADAYKVAQLKQYNLTAREAFYLASLGAAKALHLDRQLGNLMPGKYADFVLLNPARHAVVGQRLEHCRDIDEELFVYMTLGDERLVDETFVAGRQQYLQSQYPAGGAR